DHASGPDESRRRDRLRGGRRPRPLGDPRAGRDGRGRAHGLPRGADRRPPQRHRGGRMSGDILRGAPPHAGSTAYIHARIVDPTADKEYTGAILISDGKIADFGPSLFASGAPYGIQSVDCRGLHLAPGLVDARVHTGEPGEEHKETLESAGIAAAVGGITS